MPKKKKPARDSDLRRARRHLPPELDAEAGRALAAGIKSPCPECGSGLLHFGDTERRDCFLRLAEVAWVTKPLRDDETGVLFFEGRAYVQQPADVVVSDLLGTK